MNKNIEFYSHLAHQAMLAEVNLTPKPGLVDRISHGAHSDMTIQHFYASADAIAPYLSQFILAGYEHYLLDENSILPAIRPIGVYCEQAMLNATSNVNTHKGSIFSLGLVCAAVGRLMAYKQAITPTNICDNVAGFCRGIVEQELKLANQHATAGQRLFAKHGLTGARGEAESGFKTVLTQSLPTYLATLAKTNSEQQALHQALLHLMAVNNDTNVISRGGFNALTWLQQRSLQLLQDSGVDNPNYLDELQRFDDECIEKNLSPGGSADLLILTWFFAKITIT